MKKINEVIKEYSEFAKLIRSVYKNLDKEDFVDIYNYGTHGGYGNFIYYSDTVPFWRQNKQQIVQLLIEEANSLGEGVLEMVRHFNCIGEDYELYEIGECIFGNYSDSNDKCIYNELVLFSVQKVVGWFLEEN